MRDYLSRIAKFALIFFVLTNMLALGCDLIIKKSQIFKPNWIMNRRVSDNIILGSSRALTGVNTALLISQTNDSWTNLSIDDTPIEVHLLELKLLIEQGIVPRTVLLQYDRGESFEDMESRFSDRDYQFLPWSFAKGSKPIWEYLKSKENGFGAMIYNVPIFRYSYYNTELFFSALKLVLNPDYLHRSNRIGDYSYPDDLNNLESKKYYKAKDKVIVNLDDPKFQEFVRLCNAHKINLVVFTAPYLDKLVEYKGGKQTSVVNLSGLLKCANNFYDDLHIKSSARDSVTIELLKYIKINDVL